MISIADVNHYTEHGIIVHPLVPAVLGNKETGKAPIPLGWSEKTTPYNVKYLERELSKGCNIGANCGKASDLTVIDIDYNIQSIWDYIFAGIDTSKFVTQQRTEKDGKKHLLFKYTPYLKTETHSELGFDIRNDGGNIVLAPSIHSEGDTYRMLSSIESRPELPEMCAEKINQIIEDYAQLKRVFGTCRSCFYKLWKDVFSNKDSDIYHDTSIFRQNEGRARHLNLMAELRANGATDGQLTLANMIIFGEHYKENVTSKELKGVKADRTAKTETLKADEYYSRYIKNTDKYGLTPACPNDATEAQSLYREVTPEELASIRNTHDTLRLNLNLPDDHFITQFVEWSDSLNDGYKEYKIVTAFWLLSALVQQKVYSRWSTGTIYPNIWAFLIGPSTISRKTTVMDNGRDIYITATRHKIPDTDYSLEGYAESLVETPVINCVRDEVSTLLSKMGQKYNDGYFEFECSMYDGKPYVKTLASKGKGAPQSFTVENTYITKLYATTPVKLSQSMDTRAFDSGFGFRFLFASPCYSRELKGHRRLTDEDVKKWSSIMERTRNLNNIFTESPEIAFEIEPEAEKFYSEKTLEILNKLASEEYCNDTLLAVWGRLEAYIIKLAMLIEIGKRKMSLKITLNSLIIAFSMVCSYFVPSTISVYNQLLEDTRHNNIEKIIAELRKMRGIATHKDLLNRCKLVAKDFNECIVTMHESGAIEIVISKSKNNKEAKTYLLKNENANVVPKDVFDIDKIVRTLQMSQDCSGLQVLKHSNVESTSENLESLQNFGQLYYDDNNCDLSEKSIKSLECGIQLSNKVQDPQILSGSSNVRISENLGNLTDLSNFRSPDVCIEVSVEDAAKILEEEQ